MSRKITFAAILIALLALFAGACSSSDSEAETTTTKKETTTTQADGTDTDEEDASAPVSDAEFDETIGEFTGRIEAAGTDTCAVFEAIASESEFPDPANPTQVETAVGVYDVMFGAIAATAPPEFAAQAAIIVAAGDDLSAEALANDYDPEWFLTAVETAFTDEELSAALDTYYQEATAACAPSTETTVAG